MDLLITYYRMILDISRISNKLCSRLWNE